LGFITLAQGVVFDTTNEEGRLLHTASGECLAFDRIATILLQSGLEQATKEEVIANVQTWIEASNQQVEEGLQVVIQQLRACNMSGSDLADVEIQTPPASTPALQPEGHGDESFCANTRSSQQEPVPGQRASWEVFLTGTLINEPLPPMPLFRRVSALSTVVSILFVLGGYRLTEHLLVRLRLPRYGLSIQQQEWKHLCRLLSALPVLPSRLWAGREVEVLERLARRELIWCQFIVRSFAPKAMCLVRSLAFCAYLRAAGLPAQLLVGREQFCLSEDDAFHAWVELAGRVVNDHDEVQTGYTVMHRVP
jgi:Transglutaminase-like superfamily